MKFKVTSLIALILIILLIGAIAYILNLHQINNTYLIYGIIGILFLSIVSNLISFLITHFFDQQSIYKKASDAFVSIDEIKHSLDKSTMVLYKKNRKSVYHVGFYNDIYNNATIIKISGWKITELIDNIVKKNKEKDNWVKKLEQRENISVKILMLSLSADISSWEDREGLPRDSIKKEITGNIDKLKKFSENLQKDNKKLAYLSSLTIRVTKDIQPFKITYAGNLEKQPTDILLLNISFNKDDGPLYEIPDTNEVNTHKECLTYYDRIYDKGKDLFFWNDNEIIFNEENSK